MKKPDSAQASPSGEERIMKNILLWPQPRSKVRANSKEKAALPLVDHYDNVTRLISFVLNVKLDDVFVLEDVVAVDHLTLVFVFAPDSGILQLPRKIHMNGLCHIQDR